MRSPEAVSVPSQVSRCAVPTCSSQPVPFVFVNAPRGSVRTLSTRRPGSRTAALYTGWFSAPTVMGARTSSATAVRATATATATAARTVTVNRFQCGILASISADIITINGSHCPSPCPCDGRRAWSSRFGSGFLWAMARRVARVGMSVSAILAGARVRANGAAIGLFLWRGRRLGGGAGAFVLVARVTHSNAAAAARLTRDAVSTRACNTGWVVQRDGGRRRRFVLAARLIHSNARLAAGFAGYTASSGRVSGAGWAVGFVGHHRYRRRHGHLWEEHWASVDWCRRWWGGSGCVLETPAPAHDHAGYKRARRHCSKNGELTQPRRPP